MLNQRMNKVSLTLLSIIVVAGAIIRFSYYQSLCSDPFPTIVSASNVFDQSRFIELAREFSSENWLGSKFTSYSPAYSYFIAVIFKVLGSDMYNVFLIQFLFGILAIVLFYKTALLLFENNTIALWAAAFSSLYSPLIFFEGTLLRASVVAYANLLSFYFLLIALKKEKNIYFLFAGLAIGFSTVLRTNILLFLLIPYIYIASPKSIKQKTKYVLLLILGVAMFTAPLSIRNNILKEEKQASSQGPSVFWIGNTHDASGIGLWRSPLRGKYANEANGSVLKTLQIFAREVKLHPQEYFDIYKRKIKMFFNAYEIPGNLSYDQFLQNHKPLRWAIVNFKFISPLALLGLALCWRRHPFISLCYLYLGVLAISNILFHIQGRYRIPSIPFFILFAAFAWHYLYQNLKQRNLKPAVLSLALFFSFTILTSEDHKTIYKYFGGKIRPIDFGNRFVGYHLFYTMESHSWTDKQKEAVMLKAIAEQDKEIKSYPESYVQHRGYILARQAVLYEEIKDKHNAKRMLDQALRTDPIHKNELLKTYRTKYIHYKKDTFKDLSFDNFTSRKAHQKVFE